MQGPEPVLMGIPELSKRLGISKSKAYELAQADALPFPVVKEFGRRLVSRAAVERWFEQYDVTKDTSVSQ